MSLTASSGRGPELFLGFAAAVGTDLERVIAKFNEALERVRYRTFTIRLAGLMKELPFLAPNLILEPVDEYIDSHMTQGNELRKTTGRNDALAILGIGEIQKIRQESRAERGEILERSAYILRSLKHPDEVETLRTIYGRAFYLIAAYAPHDQRRDYLAQRIARSRNDTPMNKYYADAERLILRDQEELGLTHGQNLRGTYHRADVFVDTTNEEMLTKSVSRFVELIFGNTLHTPTRGEYGMFHAKAAALRSAELGRQVGAAISRDSGDILAVGTNEVPRAGGGLYWCEDKPDMREFVLGRDSNDEHKRNLIADTLMRLQQAGWLAPAKSKTKGGDLVKDALAGDMPALSKQSLIRNVIEYGRAVHAEMAAIVDAARQGVSIAECNMYVTAFPCHLCARHIVAAGIHRVLYIEPYPKSLAAELYPDSIRVESVSIGDNQVSFEPFVGVAPRQYMYLFEASARKDRDGNAILFDSNKAQMRYRASERIYLEEEDLALRKLSSILDRQGTLFGGEHA
ncbi:MAG TPA: anti-phage dCTP deaminase [Candidatus Acidoferrales bacterium]|jgi:deoxycytidylate deaminase|nr:anti-phage dCTP deaminase [Candidatus Acidoferrales bacterium]